MTQKNYLTVLSDVLNLPKYDKARVIVDLLNKSNIDKETKIGIILEILENVNPDFLKTALTVINAKKRVRGIYPSDHFLSLHSLKQEDLLKELGLSSENTTN